MSKKLKRRVKELEDSVWDHDADVQHLHAQIRYLSWRVDRLAEIKPDPQNPPFWQGPMCSTESRNERDSSSMVAMPAEVFGAVCDRTAEAAALLERCEPLLNTNPSLHHDVSKWLNEYAPAE